MFLFKFPGLFAGIIASVLASDFCPSPTAAPEQPCPPEWTCWRGSCYRLTKEAASWENSRLACQDMGGRMAAPHSPVENEFIVQLAEVGINTTEVWIGCRQQEQEGVWVCEGQGQGKPFLNWHNHEPNDHNNEEDCVEIWKSGTWNDNKCQSQGKAICARPSPKQPRYCFYTDARGRISNSKCLVGYLIRESVCRAVTNCGSACLKEPRCYSFNVKMQGGRKVCQLNNATGSDDPTKFRDTGFLCMYAEPCF